MNGVAHAAQYFGAMAGFDIVLDKVVALDVQKVKVLLGQWIDAEERSRMWKWPGEPEAGRTRAVPGRCGQQKSQSTDEFTY